MDTEQVILISSLTLPVLILAAVVLLVIFTRRRHIKTRDQLLMETKKYQEKETSNKLWQELVSVKERHISVLREKIKRLRY